jgi:glycosyltransferase involved in cell wall biosynthesis
MRKKIAFISHTYMEPATRTKLVYMAKREDVRFITPNSYPTSYGWRNLDTVGSPGLRVQSYPIHFLNFQRTSTRWFLRSRDLGFACFLPDIIHVENEFHSWITCQVLLCRSLFAPKAKVVVFTWENLTVEEQGTKARLLEYLSAYNRGSVDFFICGNRAGRDILLAKGIPAEKVDVLPQWGVDPEVFYPYLPQQREACRRRLGLLDSEFAIGFVGRLVEEKGIMDLLGVTERLCSGGKQTPTLVLAGSGHLEQVAISHCAERHIKLVTVPPCCYERVPEVMNALDLFVLPSQSRPFWKEQFGHVLIEAMACGVTVIGSDCGAIPEVIGDAGLIFRERESEQLFGCIRSCMESDGLRSTLRDKGLRRVLDNFTNSVIADRTLQIYDRFKSQDDAGKVVPGSHGKQISYACL